jgi:tetratricopeptide (TPR) repeat protein
LAVRLKRTPTLASEYGDRGDAFIWSHQYEKGIADLDRVVAMKPGDADALNARCFSRALVGKDLDKALADCNAALDIDPKNAMILDSRGFVYFRMGQDDKAMVDLKAALKIQPQQAPSLYVKGLIELHAHNQAKADTDFAVARALQPTVADTYQRFGVN